jgi:hypothetical protein
VLPGLAPQALVFNTIPQQEEPELLEEMAKLGLGQGKPKIRLEHLMEPENKQVLIEGQGLSEQSQHEGGSHGQSRSNLSRK